MKKIIVHIEVLVLTTTIQIRCQTASMASGYHSSICGSTIKILGYYNGRALQTNDYWTAKTKMLQFMCTKLFRVKN